LLCALMPPIMKSVSALVVDLKGDAKIERYHERT
jgi:hypothetical protein